MIQSFGAKEKHKLLNPLILKVSIYAYCFGLIFPFILFPEWALSHWFLALLSAFLWFLLPLLRIKERAVYQIIFNDDSCICTIRYYFFFFIKRERRISYEKLVFRYMPTRYMSTVFVNAFQILRKWWLIFEVRQLVNVGWEKEEILRLNEYTKNNPLLNYDKGALKRWQAVLFPE